MSFPNNLRQQKQNLRRVMEARRAGAFAGSSANAALAIRDRLLASIPLPPKAIVGSYFPRGSEMDPTPLDNAFRERGYLLALPIVTGKSVPLIFRSYHDGDDLVEGALKVPEPGADAAEVDPTLLIIPLLAFDKRCYRLGYGGGYYDRTLKLLRQRHTILAIGIAFACQEIPEVPVGVHDVALDTIVTENELFQS